MLIPGVAPAPGPLPPLRLMEKMMGKCVPWLPLPAACSGLGSVPRWRSGSHPYPVLLPAALEGGHDSLRNTGRGGSSPGGSGETEAQSKAGTCTMPGSAWAEMGLWGIARAMRLPEPHQAAASLSLPWDPGTLLPSKSPPKGAPEAASPPAAPQSCRKGGRELLREGLWPRGLEERGLRWSSVSSPSSPPSLP